MVYGTSLERTTDHLVCRDVTQKSLRQAIGVVPQDSVLFNSSIRYNIGFVGFVHFIGHILKIHSYGKFDSSLEEIEAAAKSAQMHERIMSFPEGTDIIIL